MNTLVTDENRVQIFFKRTYAFLALGILITAVVSAGASILFPELIISIAQKPFFYIGAFVVQLLLIVSITRFAQSNVKASSSLYVLFTALEGLLLSPIFFIYSPQTIITAFVSSISLFGVMAIIGYTTKIDTSRWYGILFGTTIALIIVSLINIFVLNSMVALITSWITIVIFSGWSIYDSQRLKIVAQQSELSNLNAIAISGALNFYLDILNFFVSLLRIFGNAK